MDYMTAYALKNADPKYKDFDEKISFTHKERRNINIKQCQTLRRINNMMHALDVVREKSYDFEESSAKLDKTLKDATTTDGEGWFWTYHNAGEEMEKCMIAQCIKVANLAANYDALGERLQDLRQQQEKLGDQIVKKAEAKKCS